MSQKFAALPSKPPAGQVVRDIRRTRKLLSAEETIRIVLDGLRGEGSIAALCRREGIAESLYYSWRTTAYDVTRIAGGTGGARAAGGD